VSIFPSTVWCYAEPRAWGGPTAQERWNTRAGWARARCMWAAARVERHGRIAAGRRVDADAELCSSGDASGFCGGLGGSRKALAARVGW
jgi:hypothetical protein